MKKILIGLVALGLLIAMTGVVSAGYGDYCKVTGGGTLTDASTGDLITISFNAQGICVKDSDVKGKVTIVNHGTKEKFQLAVTDMYICFDGGSYRNVLIGLENEYQLYVCDHGEGSNMVEDDHVAIFGIIGPQFRSTLNGNAQVRISPVT